MAQSDHHGHSQGPLQGQGDGQVQTGFDTFVMTGDMIIKTTSKVASPSSRPKPEKPPSGSINTGSSSDSLPQHLEQAVVPPAVTSQVEVTGSKFPEVPVELDIPPDDISSEDERYRINGSEDLDITNLPPPPAEFLGEFSEPCPTSLMFVDQSQNWRNSLDEAILQLQSRTTLGEACVVHENQPQHLVEDTTRLEVSDTGRADSFWNPVSAGVQASRSQDTGCGSSGVGLVNIEVGGPSSSVEALHCNDSPEALLLLNKSNKTQLLHQPDDVVWYRTDNSELLSKSAANQRSVVNSVEEPVRGDTDSNVRLVEPSACYRDSSSPEHLLVGGSASVEPSWRSPGQGLPGGGKVSTVRRAPSGHSGAESAAEFNHHVPTSWNNVADTSRTQLKDADHPSACRLAKRLYDLDGFRKSDVSKHLSKKYAIIFIYFVKESRFI